MGEENLQEGAVQDKYILHMENFEGPLDLLWGLIRRAKIDIMDVSLSTLTEQYLAYLRLMERLNISIAAEFIAMASELIYYKSKALLPTGEIEDEFFVPPLPPELIQKLLEYKKYQQSAMQLRAMYEQQEDCFTRSNVAQEAEIDSGYVSMSLFDLLNAFIDVLGSKKEVETREIIFDDVLVSDRIQYIIDRMCSVERVLFTELFPADATRPMLIATFLAILELVKMQKVKVVQHVVFGDINIMRAFDPATIREQLQVEDTYH